MEMKIKYEKFIGKEISEDDFIKLLIYALQKRHSNDWQQTFDFIQFQSDEMTNEELMNAAQELEPAYVKNIFITDIDYPDILKTKAYMPPYMLNYIGNKEILNDKNIVSFWGIPNWDQFEKLTEHNKTICLNKKRSRALSEDQMKHLKELVHKNKDVNFIFINHDMIDTFDASLTEHLNNVCVLSEFNEYKNQKNWTCKKSDWHLSEDSLTDVNLLFTKRLLLYFGNEQIISKDNLEDVSICHDFNKYFKEINDPYNKYEFLLMDKEGKLNLKSDFNQKPAKPKLKVNGEIKKVDKQASVKGQR